MGFFPRFFLGCYTNYIALSNSILPLQCFNMQFDEEFLLNMIHLCNCLAGGVCMCLSVRGCYWGDICEHSYNAPPVPQPYPSDHPLRGETGQWGRSITSLGGQ